jgi:hypothetical protein
VIIDYNMARIKTPDDHWAVKCRDIPMVVRRLYSGNVIVNDYVFLDVKCRDIPMVTFYSQDYVIMIITLPE